MKTPITPPVVGRITNLSGVTPPTPIYRGEVNELKSMLADLQAKVQLPASSSSGLSATDVMNMVVSIERQALEIAWMTVKTSGLTSEEIRDIWLGEAEIIAKYIKRRLGMPA